MFKLSKLYILGRCYTTYSALDRGRKSQSLSTLVRSDWPRSSFADRQPSIRRGSWTNWSSANWIVLGEVRIFQNPSIGQLEKRKVRFSGYLLHSWVLLIFNFSFRYRYAALPKKFTEVCTDKRLTPRVSPFMFPGSQILSRNKMPFQRLLNQWFGVPKQTWQLVYR